MKRKSNRKAAKPEAPQAADGGLILWDVRPLAEGAYPAMTPAESGVSTETVRGYGKEDRRWFYRPPPNHIRPMMHPTEERVADLAQLWPSRDPWRPNFAKLRVYLAAAGVTDLGALDLPGIIGKLKLLPPTASWLVPWDDKDPAFASVKWIIDKYNGERPAKGYIVRLNENKVREFCERHEVHTMSHGQRRKVHKAEWARAFKRYGRKELAQADASDPLFIEDITARVNANRAR